MEFGFWESNERRNESISWSLNPCYNGIWFLSFSNLKTACNFYGVLILVIMEFGFWAWTSLCNEWALQQVLILVIMEFGFWVNII